MAVDEYKPGSMDIREKQAGWDGFTKLVTWSCVAMAVLLIAMRIFLI